MNEAESLTGIQAVLQRGPGALGRLLAAAAPNGVTPDRAGAMLSPDGELVVDLAVPDAGAVGAAPDADGWDVSRAQPPRPTGR
ncbi:hypothetical protein [Micromonospora sp. NPDC000442]|uniref:hypothetical protein n=1 Tax=Micromonospora sp. NPDC000442 TaxID=3364217 RepID=UPI0036A681D7